MDVEQHITIAESIQHFPKRNGKSVRVKTVLNRIRNGCHGVRLRAEKIGNTWYTKPLWIQQFVADCTAQAGNRTGTTAASPYASETASQHLRERFKINVGSKT